MKLAKEEGTATEFLEEKASELKYFQSTSWVVIKGAWFMDFNTELFSQLVEFPEKTLTALATDTYNKTLKRHHPWILQKGAALGMKALPNRAYFLGAVQKQETEILGRPYSDEELLKDFTTIS